MSTILSNSFLSLERDQVKRQLLNHSSAQSTSSFPTNPIIHTDSIGAIIKRKLDKVSDQNPNYNEENAFVVGDLGEIYRQHRKWKKNLPRVEPFYAVKCNPDPVVVKLLASLGIGFDCASMPEIQQVLELVSDPGRIIYANPCKQPSFIRYAANSGVSKMTFDHPEELYKVKKLYPDAEMVLRITADDSKSAVPLSNKFGAPLEDVRHLLRLARNLNVNVIGVSFHVGSGCFDEKMFADALYRARSTFDQAAALGFHFTLLDIGGGFPSTNADSGISFEKVAAVINPILDAHFPPYVRVIAEPGRYYVGSAFVACAQITGHRKALSVKGDQEKDTTKLMYYLNDGVFNTYMNRCVIDHEPIDIRALKQGNQFLYGRNSDALPQVKCSIWGPTCDGSDCLINNASLPLLQAGDWVYHDNMGAYAYSCASEFNGFAKAKPIYTNTFHI